VRKVLCKGIMNEMKELLGETTANDVLYGLLQASDQQLEELRRCVEAILVYENAAPMTTASNSRTSLTTRLTS
jgi:hypothetical protein